jgi:hypothetical protein
MVVVDTKDRLKHVVHVVGWGNAVVLSLLTATRVDASDHVR